MRVTAKDKLASTSNVKLCMDLRTRVHLISFFNIRDEVAFFSFYHFDPFVL